MFPWFPFFKFGFEIARIFLISNQRVENLIYMCLFVCLSLS